MIARIFLLVVLLNSFFNCEATKEIKGVIVPVLTPYYKNSTAKINYDQVKVMAEYFRNASVDGVLVAGITGEGYLLNVTELKELYKAWVDAGRTYGLSVLVVVGDISPDAIRLAKYAESIGVDAILALLPLLYRPMNAQDAVENFKLLADKVENTRVLLFVDPPSISLSVRVDDFYNLATQQVPNFAGLRCPIEIALSIRAAKLYKTNQLLLINLQYSVGVTFFSKFNATVAASNSILPELAVAVKNTEDRDKVYDLNTRINDIIFAIAAAPRYDIIGFRWISYLKAAFTIITCIEVGGVRLPLKTLNHQEKRNLTKAFLKLNITMKCPEKLIML